MSIRRFFFESAQLYPADMRKYGGKQAVIRFSGLKGWATTTKPLQRLPAADRG